MTIYEHPFRKAFNKASDWASSRSSSTSYDYVARLQTALIEELHRYGERTLTANSLEAVFADPT